MKRLRRSLTLLTAAGALFAGSLATASARPEKESATNTFIGAVTPATAPGPVFPVAWNCDQPILTRQIQIPNTTTTITAYAIPYTYIALGEAKGTIPGSFTYEEHAWALFTSPQCPNVDPTKLVGSAIGTQEIRLKPKKQNRDGVPSEIKLLDTKTSDFVLTPKVLTEAQLKQLPQGVVRDLRKALRNGPVPYWTWTFTSNNGKTYTGYLSGDSKELAITVTFDVVVDD